MKKEKQLKKLIEIIKESNEKYKFDFNSNSLKLDWKPIYNGNFNPSTAQDLHNQCKKIIELN